MPHLSIETFVSQYFWLVVVFFSLYYILTTKLLPLISEAYKARSGFNEVVGDSTHSKVVKDSSLIKDIALLNFNSAITHPSYNSQFTKNFLTWSNSKVK